MFIVVMLWINIELLTGNSEEIQSERKISEEREKWEKEKTDMQVKRNEEEYQRALAAVDNAILDLFAKSERSETGRGFVEPGDHVV
jgi:L-alanine-DL-glutamate epimerase-like enolase superfamily enzyme